MRVIDWNIKCFCDIDKIASFLKEKVMSEQCIVALQEVMPDKADKLKEKFGEEFHIVYSLDYREPDEFDGGNRKLGLMFLVSKDMKIIFSGVFERCLFPERTLYAKLGYGDKVLKVVDFHSVTGCDYGMAKAAQFRSYAASIKAFKPDFIMIDANEPESDHYDMAQMEFFSQGRNDNGEGAKTFFTEIVKLGLKDAYVEKYDKTKFVKGKPLVVSHLVMPRKTERRYDFMFVKDDFEINKVEYLYEEAREASSDHAMIVAELNI